MLGNFYLMLALIFAAVIVLQAREYSLLKKMVILLVISLAMFWLDQSEWFMRLFWQAQRMLGIK